MHHAVRENEDGSKVVTVIAVWNKREDAEKDAAWLNLALQEGVTIAYNISLSADEIGDAEAYKWDLTKVQLRVPLHGPRCT